MYTVLALYISPMNGETGSVAAAMAYGPERLALKAIRLGQAGLRERMRDGKRRGFYCSCEVLVFESEEARSAALIHLLEMHEVLHGYHSESDIDVRYRSLTPVEYKSYRVASVPWRDRICDDVLLGKVYPK
jgi:hypothetical protein